MKTTRSDSPEVLPDQPHETGAPLPTTTGPSESETPSRAVSSSAATSTPAPAANVQGATVQRDPVISPDESTARAGAGTLSLAPVATSTNAKENPPPEPLSEKEQARLDELLSWGRTFHYASFVVAGLSLALGSLDTSDGVKLPIGDVVLPRAHASIAMYFLTLALAATSVLTYDTAAPFLPLDPRRVPYAWLSVGRPSTFRRLAFWTMLPVLLAAIANSRSIPGNKYGLFASFVGAFSMLSVRFVSNYLWYLTNRIDTYGKPMSYSIYWLYWIRFTSGIAFISSFLFAILAAIPKWTAIMIPIAEGTLFFAAGIRIIRALFGPLVYKPLDRLGLKRGFAPTPPDADPPRMGKK